MNSVGAELIVSGLVQGVGFRFFCYQSAIRLNLTGWVKNNPDGSVTAFVEGERSLVEEYITQVKLGPVSSDVNNLSVKWIAFSGQFNKFEITR